MFDNLLSVAFVFWQQRNFVAYLKETLYFLFFSFNYLWNGFDFRLFINDIWVEVEIVICVLFCDLIRNWVVKWLPLVSLMWHLWKSLILKVNINCKTKLYINSHRICDLCNGIYQYPTIPIKDWSNEDKEKIGML